MKQTEIVGWIGMCMGLLITLLPFTATYINSNISNNNPILILISILGLVIFVIGFVKAIPEIINSLFKKQNDEVTNQ